MGLKNYRHECPKNLKTISESNTYSCNLHPHNLVLELLSETGLIGLALFSLFIFYLIKQYFYKEDYLAWLSVFIQITPLVNGSFFTTFSLNLFLLTMILVVISSLYRRHYQAVLD